jgi:hypothetical protein
VQFPTDVTVTVVAALSTDTTFPANKSVLVAVLGVTEPVLAVKLKLGPKSAPKGGVKVTVIFILFYFY